MTQIAERKPVDAQAAAALQTVFDRSSDEDLVALRDAALERPRHDADEKRREQIENAIRKLVSLLMRVLSLNQVKHAGGFSDRLHDRALRLELARRIDAQLEGRALRQAQADAAAAAPATAEELRQIGQKEERKAAEIAAMRRAERLAEAAKTADQQATAPVVYAIVKTQHDARRAAPAPASFEVAADEIHDEQPRHPAPAPRG